MDRRAFTLTELLVVVAIVGILATIGLPRLVKTLEKAKVNEALSNLDFIRNAQKRYFLANGTFTLDMDSLPIENPNNTAARCFDYTIENADSSDFIARAKRKNNAPGLYSTYYYEINKSGSVTSNGPLI